MKCPKCGYFGPDSLNSCKKCGKDLLAEKAKLGLSSSKTRSFKIRPIPQKEPAPPGLIPEAPNSAGPFQEKTSPLFTNELPELLIAPQFVNPKNKEQDFSTGPFEVKFEEQKKGLGGEFKTGFSFEKKHGETLPAATLGEDSREIKMAPNDVKDFEFPEDLTKTSPPLSALASNEELSLPDEQEQEKVDLSMNGVSLHEKDGEKEGDKELLSAKERGKILRMTSPLKDQSPGEAPPGRIKTEPLDDEEIAEILEDIDPEPSEPGRAT